MDRTILITGANRGLGHAFATAALDAGHRVVGTMRNDRDRRDFEAIEPGRAMAFLLDVSDHARIPSAIRTIEAEVGAIDVLISNAGYGHEGVLEESPLEALIRQFDVNVFGAVAVIKTLLPGMRQRRRGHIITLSSLAGHVPFPGIAYYSASKFAVEAIAGVLAKEVAAFGIHVTSVAPGSFRTDWAGSSLVRAERSIAEYDAIFDPIRAARQAKSGHQVGNPAKAAEALMKIIEADRPPLHLVLGKDALRQVREHANARLAELDAWEALSLSTEYE